MRNEALFENIKENRFVMNDKEKMHTGELYYPSGDEIMSEQLKCLNKLYDFNLTRPTELDKRAEMLKENVCRNRRGLLY